MLMHLERAWRVNFQYALRLFLRFRCNGEWVNCYNKEVTQEEQLVACSMILVACTGGAGDDLGLFEDSLRSCDAFAPDWSLFLGSHDEL